MPLGLVARPSWGPPILQLFLEQNEDEAEKMAEKEEKAREIEKSTIKVSQCGVVFQCVCP